MEQFSAKLRDNRVNKYKTLLNKVATMQMKSAILLRALTITILLLLLFPSMKCLAASVTGRYVKGSGTTVSLEVSIKKPAPSSIIVEQTISPKNKIKNVSPKPQKIGGKGKVKWLIKNVRPGRQRFTIKLAQPLSGSVRGYIRYKDPASGKFSEMSITP